VGGEERPEGEPLRRLRAPEPVAGAGRVGEAVRARPECIDHRLGGDGAGLPRGPGDPGEEGRRGEGARRVVDQHGLGRVGLQRGERVPHRLGPARAASDRGQQPGVGDPGHGGVVERPGRGVDRDHDASAGRGQRGAQRPGQDGLSGEGAVLLRHRPAEAQALSRGHDHDGGLCGLRHPGPSLSATRF